MIQHNEDESGLAPAQEDEDEEDEEVEGEGEEDYDDGEEEQAAHRQAVVAPDDQEGVVDTSTVLMQCLRSQARERGQLYKGRVATACTATAACVLSLIICLSKQAATLLISSLCKSSFWMPGISGPPLQLRMSDMSGSFVRANLALACFVSCLGSCVRIMGPFFWPLPSDLGQSRCSFRLIPTFVDHPFSIFRNTMKTHKLTKRQRHLILLIQARGKYNDNPWPKTIDFNKRMKEQSKTKLALSVRIPNPLVCCHVVALALHVCKLRSFLRFWHGGWPQEPCGTLCCRIAYFQLIF